MKPRVHLSPPDVGEAEEEALRRAVRSGWAAPVGPELDAFERQMAERTGRAHAVALSSGTAALHLGLLTLGVGAGDVVVTATTTFAATANAVVYTGATPVFVDCDGTGNVSPSILAWAVDDQVRHGRRVAAILPVDVLGKVADYGRIGAIARDHGIPVLADAAESVGATRDGRQAGSFGRCAAFSFNGNKIMTTSGGGMLLTDDEAQAQRVRYLATQARRPVDHYEHTDVGYNYRLSNLLAAVGTAQLSRLDEMVRRRRQIRAAYRALFAGVPGVSVLGGEDGAADPSAATRDNCWLTAVLVDADVAGFSAADLRADLAASGIETRPLWKPMHLQPVHARYPSYLGGCSEDLYRRGVALPSGSGMAAEDEAAVHARLAAFLRARAA